MKNKIIKIIIGLAVCMTTMIFAGRCGAMAADFADERGG